MTQKIPHEELPPLNQCLQKKKINLSEIHEHSQIILN